MRIFSGTIANVFIEAGGQKVNAVFLAAKAKVESSGGTSTLARGTVEGYRGWYNFYGLGASDGANSDKNGAKYAKQNGWNTPDKAIKGGVQIIYERYVNTGKDTLYTMKWAIAKYINTGHVQNAQYATNIMDAYIKASNFAKGLKDIDAPLTFVIPVYK